MNTQIRQFYKHNKENHTTAHLSPILFPRKGNFRFKDYFRPTNHVSMYQKQIQGFQVHDSWDGIPNQLGWFNGI